MQSHLTVARTWATTLSVCEGLTWGGRTDWRVPNASELLSIVDHTRSSQAIDPLAFLGTTDEFFWTSTTVASDATKAWIVRFSDGLLGAYYGAKTSTYPVRCVAGGPN